MPVIRQFPACILWRREVRGTGAGGRKSEGREQDLTPSPPAPLPHGEGRCRARRCRCPTMRLPQTPRLVRFQDSSTLLFALSPSLSALCSHLSPGTSARTPFPSVAQTDSFCPRRSMSYLPRRGTSFLKKAQIQSSLQARSPQAGDPLTYANAGNPGKASGITGLGAGCKRRRAAWRIF